MKVDAISQFFEMGGYGGYVWPAYAVAAIVLGLLFGLSLRAVRSNEAQLRTLQELHPPRRRETPEARS